jgi:probable phosphomutase (TIGR03848 family)
MPDVYLIRHGRSSANTSGVLAGRLPGVHLDATGETQVDQLGRQLSGVQLAAVVSSPLERTLATAQAILRHQKVRSSKPTAIHEDYNLIECGYGEWTGKSLTDLSKLSLWKDIQNHPSSVRFPGSDGESFIDMQARAVNAIRTWNSQLPTRSAYAMISHGDVIKSILADALGMHLDHFQRINIDPGSVSVVRYTRARPYVLTMNAQGPVVDRFFQGGRRRKTEAVVGGGSGE